ncbi:hypothetical protein HKBW3S47_02420, partial [Candidatus Hakubella thermalkaliphila]
SPDRAKYTNFDLFAVTPIIDINNHLEKDGGIRLE